MHVRIGFIVIIKIIQTRFGFRSTLEFPFFVLGAHMHFRSNTCKYKHFWNACFWWWLTTFRILNISNGNANILLRPWFLTFPEFHFFTEMLTFCHVDAFVISSQPASPRLPGQRLASPQLTDTLNGRLIFHIKHNVFLIGGSKTTVIVSSNLAPDFFVKI